MKNPDFSHATVGGTDSGGISPPSDLDHLAVFQLSQKRLFAIAYRMLGSVEDAEDVVQEVFLRWQQAEIGEIRSPGAWLATVATRLSLNQLQSSRSRRELYIGPWLPEPLPTPDQRSPADDAELSESISIAFLDVIERLTPRERAVFLLRDVFDYEYDDIGVVLELTAANCRQIFHRSKRRLGDGVSRFPPDPEAHRRLLDGFGRAVRHGDVDGVVRLLAKDAVLRADSGGNVRGAARRPIVGAHSIGLFLAGITRKIAPPGLQVHIVQINSEPALVSSLDGIPRQVVTIAMRGKRIRGIYILANPEKLKRIGENLSWMIASAGAPLD
jgi:RNA polymerase sigma-70 factor (ECF subfamily)